MYVLPDLGNREESHMKLDKKKVRLLMANNCLETSSLAKETSLTDQTVRNAINERDINLSTAGKIAKALQVKVEAIIKED